MLLQCIILLAERRPRDDGALVALSDQDENGNDRDTERREREDKALPHKTPAVPQHVPR